MIRAKTSRHKFGVSWPVSIFKAIRTKVVAGKSPVFMGLIFLGYVSGSIHKALYAMDWVIWLYVINAVMVAIDMGLYLKYIPKSMPDGPTPVVK